MVTGENHTIESTEISLFQNNCLSWSLEPICHQPSPSPTPSPIRPVVISYNKPESLNNYIAVFFKAGEQYKVDAYLMLAIADLESVFGLKIPYNSYNPFGRTCGREYQCVTAKDASSENIIYWNKYSGWEESIYDEAKYLRERYYDKGLDTPCKIGKVYATDPYWCSKVMKLMTKWENLYPS